MPFTNEVVGGNGVLIRNAMQSQNFVSGVSGWQITKSGNAEFNSGTFRGQITSGSNPGRHVIINDQSNGWPLEVYDSSNNLIYSINNFGVATAYDPSGVNVQTIGREITFNGDPGGLLDMNMFISHIASTTADRSIFSASFSPHVGANSNLDFWGGSDDGTLPSDLRGNTRGVSGSLAQMDNNSVATGNLIKIFSGSGNVVSGGGLVITTGSTGPALFASVSFDQTLRSAGSPFCGACWYDAGTGKIGTQWYNPNGTTPTAGTTVFYRGLVIS